LRLAPGSLNVHHIHKRHLSSSSESDKKKQNGQHGLPGQEPLTSKSGKLFNTAIAAGGLATAFAGKSKFLLGGLQILKLKPLLTMGISTWAYSLFYGWPFAAGMVSLIFVHECGHVIVMKYYGVPFSPMVFIPFLGAAVAMEEPAKNAFEEAIIAAGGPVLGSAGALATALLAEASGSQLLFALADFGFMINLFNLLPVGSMDGGRIADAISPKFSALGLLAGAYIAYLGVISNPIYYLILVGGTYSFAARAFGWDDHKAKGDHYYRIGARRQMQLAALYLSLVGGLLFLMNDVKKKKKTPQQLEYERERNIEAGSTSPWAEDDFRVRRDDDEGW